MKQFRENSYGGIDVFDDHNKFLLHLNNDDLMAIAEIQQAKGDLYTVKDRIPDWVEEKIEEDDSFFDFNSHLFSGDEISGNEISRRILANEDLIQEIVKAYRFDLDYVEGADWWDALNDAIAKHVSIHDFLGEVLCDKRPKELEVGRWRIHLIEKGDLYGTDSHKVPWKEEEPCVEFYDLLSSAGQQWTNGRFYVRDLLSTQSSVIEHGRGLFLNPHRLDWVVAPGELNVICAWLGAAQRRLQQPNYEKGTVDSILAEATAESCQAGREVVINSNKEEFEK